MRARQEDKADVLISKLSSRDKQEIVLSSEHLREVGAGWCCRWVTGWRYQNLLVAQRGTNWPVNTTGSNRFPPDSQQIPNRLMPLEQWDETASSVFTCLRQTTSQCYPFWMVGVCAHGQVHFPTTHINTFVYACEYTSIDGMISFYLFLSHLTEFQVPNFCV